METHILFSVSEMEADVKNAESVFGFPRQREPEWFLASWSARPWSEINVHVERLADALIADTSGQT
jgi:hypothetical protein